MIRFNLQVPEDVLTLIQADSVYGAWTDLVSRYKFSDEEELALVHLISDIYEKKKPLALFHEELKRIFKREEKELNEITFELLISCFSFVEDYLEASVETQVLKMGYFKDRYESEKSLVKENLEYNLGLVEDSLDEEEVEELTDDELDDALAVEDINVEKEEFKKVFSKYLSNVLFSGDEAFKYLLNVRLIQVLLVMDIVYLNELLRLIGENEELITNKKIELKGKKVSGTVGYWVQDFIDQMGVDKITSLKKAQYFSKSKNVLALNQEEKHKVNSVLETYVQLKTFPNRVRSQPVERWMVFPVGGMEESKVRKYKEQALLIKTGQRKVEEKNEAETNQETENSISGASLTEETKEKSAPKGKPISIQEKAKEENKLTEEEIRSKYQGDPSENEAIAKVMEKLVQFSGSRSNQLLDYLVKQLEGIPEKIKVVAALKLIAENNNIDELMQDERLKSLLEINLSQTQNKASLQQLLKSLLELKMKLGEDESARITLQLVNILNRQGNNLYAGITHFNLKKACFEWTKL